MKQTRYYLLDNNSNLVEIPTDHEIVKNYSSFGINLASTYGIEVYQLLKLEILPIDFKVAPIKELPGYYEKRRKQLQQEERKLWEESRLRIQKIIDESKEKKRTRQQIILRVNSASQGPTPEYNKKNDPRNRINVSNGIFNKRKRGKRPPP